MSTAIFTVDLMAAETTDATPKASDRHEMSAEEALERFQLGYPDQIGPQTRRRILEVVNALPQPITRPGTRPRRNDLYALAYYLAMYGGEPASSLAGVFDMSQVQIDKWIGYGRAIIEPREGAVERVPFKRRRYRGFQDRNPQGGIA